MNRILALAADQAGQFHAELDEIAPRLEEAVQSLYSPLGELARAHIRDAYPFARGTIVLAAGLGSPDTPLLREQRILLATALEMLAVALSVHRLLLVAGPDTSLDKSLIGSTILTGDYCFSRAAALAAQTEEPVVVDLFAQALKSVSEGHLRRLFDPDAPPFDEQATLMLAGVQAVSHLAALSPQSQAAASQLVQQLVAGHEAPTAAPDALSPEQFMRWQAALAWLASSMPAAPSAS